jgi:hypothetical protein
MYFVSSANFSNILSPISIPQDTLIIIIIIIFIYSIDPHGQLPMDVEHVTKKT